MKLLGEAIYEDLIDENNLDRRFRLVYPNKEIFYLTDEEHDFLLDCVNKGQKYIQIGECTFTGSFTSLYPIRKKRVKTEYDFKDGKAVEV